MGCCSSSDAAGDKKLKNKNNKNNKNAVAGPDIVITGSEDVKFIRQVKKATYGPASGEADAQKDVTAAIRKLIAEDTMLVTGGIHAAIGEEAPTEENPKTFNAWYFSEKPDGEWEDFENITFEEGKTLALATYGLEGKAKDVTAQILELIASGKKQLVGGAHVALREPLPSDPNAFKIWYE